MKGALEKIQNQDRTRTQLAKVRAVANIIDTQWKEFADDPRPSAEDQKKVIA